MSVSVPFIIRDGLAKDVTSCLALDSSYTTDWVWQVQVERDEPHFYQIILKSERLPRTLEAKPLMDEAQLSLGLPADQCFLVAEDREHQIILGYALLLTAPAHHNAIIHSLVVDRPYRRKHIGSKLLNVARRWAKEHGAQRLLIELQTKNYPAITFCQASGLAFCGYNERYFSNQDLAVFFGQSLR